MTETETEIAGQRLKSFISRIELLEEERAGIAEEVKHVYLEAKSVGFDTPTIRKIISLRKKSSEDRASEQEILDLYIAAIGM